jgi:hypothetical protein
MPIEFIDEAPKNRIEFIDENREAQPVKVEFPQNQFIESLIQGPGSDIARGFTRGMAGVSRPLAGILDAVGVPDNLNLPKQSVEAYMNLSENVPSSTSPKIARFINEAIGETPGIIAEFEQGGALLKGLKIAPKLAQFKSMSEAAQFAAVEAMEKIGEGFKPAAEGALAGATVGLAFPAAQAAWDYGRRFGRSATKMLLRLSTGDKKLAEDFVADPKKYLPPKGEPPIDIEKTKEAGMANLEAMRQQWDDKIFDSREKMTSAINTIREAQREALSGVRQGGATTLQGLKEKGDSAVKSAMETANQKLVGSYEKSLGILKGIEEERGKAVGDAIKSVLDDDPFIAIPYKDIGPKIRQMVTEKANLGQLPISLSNFGSKIDPRTKLGVSDVEEFSTIFGDLMSYRQAGEIPLSYLQTLKTQLQELANTKFKSGSNQFGQVYAEISRMINPANLISDNPQLQKALPKLAEANKAFAEMKPKYNQAIDSFFKKDANGALIPDVDKAVRAIQKGDKAALQTMQKADALLPEKDRLLPKIKESLNDIDRVRTESLAYYKLAKRKNEDSIRGLVKKQRQDVSIKDAEKRSLIQNYRTQKRQQLMEEKKALGDTIKLLEDRETINSWMASGQVGRLLQNASTFGLGGMFVGRPEITANSALVMAGASPRIQARLYGNLWVPMGQSGDIAFDFINSARNQNMRRVLGKDIADLLEGGS